MAEKAENIESLTSSEEHTSSDDQNSDAPLKGQDEGEALDTSPGELEDKIEEIKTLNDKYLRIAAEFENYKRRAQRDQSDGIRFANEKFFKELLPIVDNLERAITCGLDQPEAGGLLEGVELTYKQFLETLTKFGIRQISSVGELFDPAMHQAVAQVESETAKSNTVVEELQKGYFLHERILRPAMVTVAKEKPAEDTSSSYN